MNIREKLIRKLWHRIEVIWIVFIFIILFLASAMKSEADLYVYDLEATLTESNVIYVDQEPFYYDIFYISTPNYATITFDNYNANLGSNNQDYDYNDPYLYILSNFPTTLENAIYSDDDGNEEIGDGLFFYLSDITFTNNMIALVTSYDPDVTGTVDFKIYSDNQLMVIPEPLAISLITLSGFGLILTRKLYAYRRDS